MKRLVMCLSAVSLMAAAAAEAGQGRGLSSARGHAVAVIDADSREWQGRLLSVAADAITVEIDSDTKQFPLASVKRVDAHGDSVKDGLIKGALFGLLVSSFVQDARFTLTSVGVYSVIGVGLDALNSCNHTVYRGPAKGLQIKVASW
jgi:hypothetical protein